MKKWWFLILLISCQSVVKKMPSINGVCLVAPRSPITTEALQPVRDVYSNWVAVVPYAFSAADGQIHYREDSRWWGEGVSGITQTIACAKASGLKVMLKPHVWVQGQGWAGDFTLNNEQAWQQWEKSYAQYISIMTHIADSMQVEMLCIGTEYKHAVVERPAFWRSLIDTVRAHYNGKLTYAANWDNYENVTFWDQLDYIGIDAYFPLCEERTPDEATLLEAWEDPMEDIKSMHEKYNKPILFTEYGYRSMDYTSQGHWNFKEDEMPANMEAQKNAYAALYQAFWGEPWFAGGFLWKWFAAQEVDEGPAGYSPQNKPALEVVKQTYGR